MSIATLVFTMLGVSAIVSTLATALTLVSRDLLIATIFSALQSTAYALMFYLLMAPDIVLVYAAVSVGIYPLIIITLIKKVGRYER